MSVEHNLIFRAEHQEPPFTPAIRNSPLYALSNGNRNTLLLCIVIVLASLCRAAPSIPETAFPPLSLQIDGFNGRDYSLYDPGAHRNNLLDTRNAGARAFPHNLYRALFNGDTTTRVIATARLLSETGDPLLNLLDHPTLPNRDHAIEGIARIAVAPIRSAAMVSYRYIDHHSDRFDSLWHRYRNEFGTMMFNDSLGLADEVAGWYDVSFHRLTASGNIAQYGYWTPTPYFFFPLYHRGVRFDNTISTTVGAAHTSLHVVIDRFDTYYNHQTPQKATDGAIHFNWNQPIGTQTTGALDVTWESRLSEPGTITCSWNTLFDKLTVDGALGITLPGATVTGSLAGTTRILSSLGFFARISRDFIGADRDHRFYEHTGHNHIDTIDYTTAPSIPNRLLANFFWKDTITHATLFVSAHDTPLWELVDTTTPDKRISQIESPFGPLVTAGITGSISHRSRVVHTTLFAGGQAILSGTNMPLHIPFYGGAEMTVGDSLSPKPSLSCHFKATGPIRQNYLLDTRGTIRTHSLPTTFSLSFRGHIPFQLPFLRNRLRSTFCAEAGPIHLGRTIRFRELPAGNLLGPRIGVQWLGYFK